MKVLVFGSKGQVAQELLRRAPEDVEIQAVSRPKVDLTRPESCAAAIAKSDADVVINAAAYTAVDAAETDADTAMIVNAEAPGAMAVAAAKRAVPFLHISTDYVLPGTGTVPFLPYAPTGPANVYGQTKRAGEKAVQAAGGQWLILRTSWVVSAHGSNFVKTMLRLGAARDQLDVVADQVGGPTPAAALADALIVAARALVSGAEGGLYHLSGAPDISWADFAREIMTRADLGCVIREIPTSAYPTPAARPLNSRLECSAFAARFDVPRPDWRSGLDGILREVTVS